MTEEFQVNIAGARKSFKINILKRAFPNILVIVLEWRFELSICSKIREKQIALGINTTWAMGSHVDSYPRVVAEIPL